jgi:hypothetical protein
MVPEDTSKELSIGVCYTGQVTARQADGTYRIAVDDPKETLSDVRLAFPVLGGHLGLQVRCNLPQLTKVKFVYGTPSFIYATIPEHGMDTVNGRTRSILWGPTMDTEQGVTSDFYSDHATDLLEGEVEFNNLYGVSLQFLTTLMRMTAGDRAAVECHLINDMVRVVSGQWRHISGLGDDLIFDHGRPTMERNWSMYRHEVIGVMAENQPYAELNGDEVSRGSLEARRVTGLGRIRFREFVGFAGDFIHSFVSDPPDTIVSLAEAKSGAGKSWIHQNSDGSILMQSVSDIRIERVCRIPVPIRYAHHEDPEITKSREYDSLTSAFLKLPQAIDPPDPKDVFLMAYHIRSYSRWLGRYHAFARMLQLDEEYKILSESESPTPEWTNGEEDRRAVNGGIEYYDAYACMSIMRDGSIVLHDGYGSSIMMSNGNVQISASRHLDLEAAGDVRIVAGNSIMLKAQRNIELSAAAGGLILHSYAWLKMLCEKGSVWLRSNAPWGETPEPKKPGAPVPEIAGQADGGEGFAVLIEAADGEAAYRSKKRTTIAVDDKPSSDTDTSCDISVFTEGDVLVRSKRKTVIQSNRTVSIGAQRLAIASPAIISNASSVAIGPVTGSPALSLQGNTLWCSRIESNTSSSNRFLGPERGPQIPTPDPQPKKSIKIHFNHIDRLQSPVGTPEGGSAESRKALSEAIQLAAKGPDLPWGNPSEGPEWAFPLREEYAWDDREKTLGLIPETLTQQYLRLDAEGDRWGGGGYENWDIREKVIGPRTKVDGGFGYYELQYKASDHGDSLHKPSSDAPAATKKVITNWTAKEKFTIKSLKR